MVPFEHIQSPAKVFSGVRLDASFSELVEKQACRSGYVWFMSESDAGIMHQPMDLVIYHAPMHRFIPAQHPQATKCNDPFAALDVLRLRRLIQHRRQPILVDC